MPLAAIKKMLFLGQPFAECGDVDRLIDEQLARVRTRIKSLRGCCATPYITAVCGSLKELVTAAQQNGHAE